MADSTLMSLWSAPDEEGCYELVIPNQSIYMLTPAGGEFVNARGPDGQTVRYEDVQWYLDFSVMVDGEIQSKRFVTQQVMGDDEAKAWAVEIAEQYQAEIGRS